MKDFEIKGTNLEGLKALKKKILELSKDRVKVGVFGGSYPNGQSIASVAMLHEFGSSQSQVFEYKGEVLRVSGVPTRSFLRYPLKAKHKELAGDTNKFKGVVIKSLLKGDVEKPLKLIGAKAESIIQQAFETKGFGTWKDNINPEYIKLKGSNQPLIDTGLLRKSITSQIERN